MRHKPKTARRRAMPTQECGQSHGLRALARRGAALLNQQCWGWGCDIRRPEGNLLLEYGFARCRCPEGVQGSSSYSLSSEAGTQIMLWGFGIFYGCPVHGGIYLSRLNFGPHLTSEARLPATIWQPQDVPITNDRAFDPAQYSTLLDGILGWIVGYEQHTLAQRGLSYRQEGLALWRNCAKALPAEQLLPSWEALGAEYRRSLAQA